LKPQRKDEGKRKACICRLFGSKKARGIEKDTSFREDLLREKTSGGKRGRQKKNRVMRVLEYLRPGENTVRKAEGSHGTL